MHHDRASGPHWKDIVWYAWTGASALIAASGVAAYLLGRGGPLAVWGL
jgi:hypothetical protein